MQLIKSEHFKEGEFICKYFHSRLIKNNKNVLGVELGGTGSGKSYRSLRQAELWYQKHFKIPFPPENICFSLKEVMKRLTSGKLRTGELLVVEEAGTSLGALDFASRVQKVFTYVLQSFRSMNIGLLFNLPYLGMLNKSARMLLHYSSESRGINFKNNLNACRLKFHQVNQTSGQIYKKYPMAKVQKVTKKLKEFNYSIPSQELIDIYEQKKEDFLLGMQTDYLDDIKIAEKKKEKAKEVLEPKEPTILQQTAHDYRIQGLQQKEIAEKMGISQAAVCGHLKGYDKKVPNASVVANNPPLLENKVIQRF